MRASPKDWTSSRTMRCCSSRAPDSPNPATAGTCWAPWWRALPEGSPWTWCGMTSSSLCRCVTPWRGTPTASS